MQGHLQFSACFLYFCCTCKRKSLLNININDTVGSQQPVGQLMHLHSHAQKVRCPYKGCGKSFEKPTVLTDSSTVPRQTYYACPYCMSKIDITVDEKMKLVGVKTAEHPQVFDSPAKCVHYFGFLNTFSKDRTIPDECLVCPKILQCSLRKR